MRERPDGVTDSSVLAVVRDTWWPRAESATHLTVGFGAHHWQVRDASGPVLFATLDGLGAQRGIDDLTATYAAASRLAATCAFVHSGLAPWAVRLGDGALSATPWLEGRPPARLDPDRTADMLDRLHRSDVPPGIRSWSPVVDRGFADRMRRRTAHPWTSGPHGEEARSAIAAKAAAIDLWCADYGRLAERTRTVRWVPTHGEPGIHNQLSVGTDLMLVDWETLRLAPPERDTRTIGVGDRGMLELFDLEWRLDEIRQYAAWFAGPHGDGADDRIAFGGLLHELER